MMIDPKLVSEVAGALPQFRAAARLGLGTASFLDVLWPALRELYVYIEPEQIAEELAVAIAIRETTLPENGKRYPSLQACAADVRGGGYLVVVEPQGAVVVYPVAPMDLVALSENAFVYVFRRGAEFILAARVEEALSNPLPGTLSSIFARPTFLRLEEALRDYRQRVMHACPFLDKAWFDNERLFLCAKPEAFMQDSLFQYLFAVMGADAEVRREQVVNAATTPVDIKVTWSLVRRLALIEIKWIGDSVDEKGKPTTAYRDARARDGISQLVQYLDDNHQLTATYDTRGYLAVYDARRKALTSPGKSPSRVDAFYYQKIDIDYKDSYDRSRTDVAEPERFFLEPVI